VEAEAGKPASGGLGQQRHRPGWIDRGQGGLDQLGADAAAARLVGHRDRAQQVGAAMALQGGSAQQPVAVDCDPGAPGLGQPGGGQPGGGDQLGDPIGLLRVG
jgi:hypothetical protein